VEANASSVKLLQASEFPLAFFYALRIIVVSHTSHKDSLASCADHIFA
jgi:hypothetical protein